MFQSLRSISRFATRLPTYPVRALSSNAKDRLIIFDTTLRDGEQSPGATLNVREKLDIARALSSLGVDVCEAGFPIASPGDFEAVKLIAQEVGPLSENRQHGPMTITGLARAMEKDIQRCYDAIKYAPSHRIHTFLATSDIHLKHKLKISRDECIQRSIAAVQFAASLTPNVEFSPEDAGRSDRDFLCELLGEVIKAGATTLNIPDTVGYTLPGEYGDLIQYLIKNTPGSERAVFSTHCHNDLGLATANSLDGVMKGARQVEVAVNGIGERAGNTALEEVIMAIQTRPHLFPVYHNIKSTHIARVSKMVSHYTGIPIQPNKAIVGKNAFSHESGIHQDGVLKHQETYEIMTPESVGLQAHQNMVLGKHSGRSAYKQRLQELGYQDITEDQLSAFVQKFKELADKNKTVTDADIEAIVADDLFRAEPLWSLVALHVTAGDRVKPTATATLRSQETGTEVTEATVGLGPVDAVFGAMDMVTGIKPHVHEFTIQSITDGSEALGDVTVHMEYPGQLKPGVFVGHGADTDILVASAKAYLNALNRLLAKYGDELSEAPAV